MNLFQYISETDFSVRLCNRKGVGRSKAYINLPLLPYKITLVTKKEIIIKDTKGTKHKNLRRIVSVNLNFPTGQN